MPRNQSEATTEVAPFDTEDSAEDAKAVTVRLAEGIADGAQITVYEPGRGGVAVQVDQDNLINTAIAITGVRVFPVVGDYDTGEIAYWLALFSGQAVKLDTNNKITKRGRTFACVAGRVNPDDPQQSSVLGREVQELAIAEPSPERPILFPRGVRKVATAAGGTYYTFQPEASANMIDLFPD